MLTNDVNSSWSSDQELRWTGESLLEASNQALISFLIELVAKAECGKFGKERRALRRRHFTESRDV